MSTRFIDSVLWSIRFLIFIKSKLSFFPFDICAFGVLSKKSSPYTRPWRFTPMFSLMSFKVLALILRYFFPFWVTQIWSEVEAQLDYFAYYCLRGDHKFRGNKVVHWDAAWSLVLFLPLIWLVQYLAITGKFTYYDTEIFCVWFYFLSTWIYHGLREIKSNLCYSYVFIFLILFPAIFVLWKLMLYNLAHGFS